MNWRLRLVQVKLKLTYFRLASDYKIGVNWTMQDRCSYLFREKSHSQGRDYRIFYLDLVESVSSLLFITLFEWWNTLFDHLN